MVPLSSLKLEATQQLARLSHISGSSVIKFDAWDRLSDLFRNARDIKAARRCVQ